MKHLKSILTILILAVAVASGAEYAMAQKKQQIKVCNKCGQHYKGTHVCENQKSEQDSKPKPSRKTCSQCGNIRLLSHFPKRSNICNYCVAKNKKKTCSQCGRFKKKSEFPENSSLCKSCMKENKNFDYNVYSDALVERANSGEAKAQCFLGNCYYEGNGVSKDYGQAFYWYRKSAE